MGNIFDTGYNTHLSPKEELAFQLAKNGSPFKNDTDPGYDLRGFWQKYGTLQPTATNGHLTDEFKNPAHFTYSNESRWYKGEPYAVNWEKNPWKMLGDMGIL